MQNAVLGFRYLIKYLEDGNEDYLDIVKCSSNGIKIWALITMYTANSDELFDSIPNYLLEKVFTCQPIRKSDNYLLIEDGDYFSYGRGFKSNCNLSYKQHFRYIRNSLAHGVFEIQDNLIIIDDQPYSYQAIFDIEWFLTLTLTCLANRRLGLAKGLSEISILGLNDEQSNIFDLIDRQQILFLVLTLMTDDLECIGKHFRINSAYPLNFDTLKLAIISDLWENLQKYTADDFYEAVRKEIKKSNDTYGKVMHIDIQDVNLSTIPFVESPEFVNLELKHQLQVVIDYVSRFDKVKSTTINLKRLLSFLKHLENNTTPSDMELFCFDYVRGFLLQSYANILFLSLIRSISLDTTYAIFDKYESKMQLSFVYAKNTYKDRLKALKRSYDSLISNGDNGRELRKIGKLISMTNKYLDEVLAGDFKSNFFRCLRNGLIHNNISIDGDEITIVDRERYLKLPFYSKKSKDKEYRVFELNRPVFSVTMKIADFLTMLDELYASIGIETSEHIDLLRTRVKRGENGEEDFYNS